MTMIFHRAMTPARRIADESPRSPTFASSLGIRARPARLRAVGRSAALLQGAGRCAGGEYRRSPRAVVAAAARFAHSAVETRVGFARGDERPPYHRHFGP